MPTNTEKNIIAGLAVAHVKKPPPKPPKLGNNMFIMPHTVSPCDTHDHILPIILPIPMPLFYHLRVLHQVHNPGSINIIESGTAA